MAEIDQRLKDEINDLILDCCKGSSNNMLDACIELAKLYEVSPYLLRNLEDLRR